MVKKEVKKKVRKLKGYSDSDTDDDEFDDGLVSVREDTNFSRVPRKELWQGVIGKNNNFSFVICRMIDFTYD